MRMVQIMELQQPAKNVKSWVKLSAWRNGCGSWGLSFKKKDLDGILSSDQHRDYQVAVFLPLKEDGILRLNTKFTPGFWTLAYPAIWFTKAAKNKFIRWLKTNGGGIDWRYGKPHKYDAAITIDGTEVHIILRDV